MKSPPQFKLNKLSEDGKKGKFLKHRSIRCTLTYPSGETSEEFDYEFFDKGRSDAVVVIPFYGGEVLLRSSIRPVLYERFGAEYGNIWEAPAGMIDRGETPREAASRELMEEAGLEVYPDKLIDLGFGFPTVGTCAERLFFFGCFVNKYDRQLPVTDGSPLERDAEIIFVKLTDLPDHIVDLKTEIAINRMIKFIEDPKR